MWVLFHFCGTVAFCWDQTSSPYCGQRRGCSKCWARIQRGVRLETFSATTLFSDTKVLIYLTENVKAHYLRANRAFIEVVTKLSIRQRLMICHQTKAISWGCYCSVSPTPPCIMCFYSFTKRLATEKKKSFGNLAKKSFSFKAMVEAELISMLRWIIVKTCPFVSMILYIGHLSPVKTTYLPKWTLKIMTLGFFLWTNGTV